MQTTFNNGVHFYILANREKGKNQDTLKYFYVASVLCSILFTLDDISDIRDRNNVGYKMQYFKIFPKKQITTEKFILGKLILSKLLLFVLEQFQ